MSEAVIRIQELILEDFQNVAKGVVQFPGNTREGFFGTKSDVLGIYGQNGSGKTALLHALAVLKSALRGKALGKEALHYIMQGKERAFIKAVFAIQQKNRQYRLEYSMVMGRRSKAPTDGASEKLPVQESQADSDAGAEAALPTAIIEAESLKYAEFEENRWSSRKTLAECSLNRQDELLKPKKSLLRLANSQSKLDDLRLAKLLSVRQGTSFLFSGDMNRLAAESNDVFSDLLHAMRNYAEYNLYIISSRGWGPITMNMGLPFHFRLEEKGEEGAGRKISMGIMMFRLDGPTVFPLAYSRLVEKTVISLNEVLSMVIPGIRLKLRRLGSQLMQDGEEAIVFEPVTTRDGRPEQIPLRDESEGIKKLISMLNMFVAAYNSPTMTLAIDEFDAGLHEYLLGELLGQFQKGGKGQLIFTSHNLRPLECLDKRSIVFTTADPEERYIRLKNVKANNNLRDVYYNQISNGINRELYEMAGESRSPCRRAGSLE